MDYFLISVSNRKNIELCIKYGLAGFTNSLNGVWTYSDVQEGDYISFLYGAKAYNLYQVRAKEAIKNAKNLPPWDPITFKMSGLTYYFPFRLYLSPIRELCESLVRTEFAYVAENLLLRGGYRKTHFQADQTTLQSVSQLGKLYGDELDTLRLQQYDTFLPRFTKYNTSPPEIFRFSEIILQAALRQVLSNTNNLNIFLQQVKINNLDVNKIDVLGEKALAEGHIDIMIKEAVPIGLARKVIIEVKTGAAKLQDVDQICNYIDELGDECLAGVLIAKNFSKKVVNEAASKKIDTFSYYIGTEENINTPITFAEIKKGLKLTKVT